MSYILEALKKSEQERQIGHVPDLSVVQEPPARPVHRWPRWLVGAVLINVLILGLIAWQPWETRKVPEQPATPAPAAMSQPTDTVGKAHEPALADARPASDDRAASPSPLPEPVTQMPLPAAAAAPTPAAPSAEEAFEHSSSDVPRWDDLPVAVRDKLPVPRIDVHVFAREPARRFVLINLRKHKEGDVLDEGATIDAILADGILLSYRGQRYRVGRP